MNMENVARNVAKTARDSKPKAAKAERMDKLAKDLPVAEPIEEFDAVGLPVRSFAMQAIFDQSVRADNAWVQRNWKEFVACFEPTNVLTRDQVAKIEYDLMMDRLKNKLSPINVMRQLIENE